MAKNLGNSSGAVVSLGAWQRGIRLTTFALALLALFGSKAVAAPSSNITLAWNASPGATGYTIMYGTAPGNYVASVNVGNQTTWTFVPPVVNQTYYFAVKAYNSAGESSASNEAGAWVGATWRTPSLQRMGDFDGDGVADPMVFRGTTGEWFARNSGSNGVSYAQWGAPALGDVPVPADYDGDGRTDFAVYRSTTGVWYINRSSAGAITLSWGSPSLLDIPVPADFDGDGLMDVAVFRRATGQWFIRRSSNGSLLQVSWGAAGDDDVPVPADYNGNGKADIVVYRRTTGQWFALFDDNTINVWSWGGPSLADVPVPADYDGDGTVDYGVFRLANATWLVHLSSTNGLKTLSWGSPVMGDIPVPADYDGDGKDDIAVYRTSTATWFIAYASGGWTSLSWGAAGSADTVGGLQEFAVVALQ